MKFSIKKNVWKGVLAALLSALTIVLIAGFDALLVAVTDPAQLAAIGLPVAAIPLVIGLLEMVRNWWKHQGRGLLEGWIHGLGK